MGYCNESMPYGRPTASLIMHMNPEPGTIKAVHLDFFFFFLFSDGRLYLADSEKRITQSLQRGGVRGRGRMAQLIANASVHSHPRNE